MLMVMTTVRGVNEIVYYAKFAEWVLGVPIMPRISVIVPIYKVEPYLRKCVDSILSQSFRDFELILVDDGSPDHCGEICDEYAKTDDRIRVIHQKNGGLSAARNAGLDIAQGEWILFIDSDDWIDSGYFDALVAAVVKQNVGVSLSTVREVRAGGKTSVVGPAVSDAMSPSEIYAKHGLLAVWAWGKLFSRELIGDLRFPVGKIQEDEFFTYRVLFKCRKVAVVADVSYNYLQRSDSIVGGKWYHERIFALDGMKEQRAYFKANGFSLADEAVTKRLFLWMVGTLGTVRKVCPGDSEDEAKLVREIDALVADQDARSILKRNPYAKCKMRAWLRPHLKQLWRVLFVVEVARGEGLNAVLRKIKGFVKTKFTR